MMNEMNEMLPVFVAKFNYVMVIILMMIGLWGMIAKKNLIKKCIAMAIFQTGIILFYISMGAKRFSTIPIIQSYTDGQSEGVSGASAVVDVAHTVGHVAGPVVDATQYANPLTQILMLTAIVVGVATLGLALTLIQKVYEQYETLNEDDLLDAIAEEELGQC